MTPPTTLAAATPAGVPRRQRGAPVRLALAMALAIPLAACQLPAMSGLTGGGPKNSSQAAKDLPESQLERFNQFSDIPIPAKADFDLDNMLVLGSSDGWIGRLPLSVGHSMADMYAFYEREMPKFGWNKITMVRAAVSTMTYSRSGRIATITLQSRTTGGSRVDFTVAPAADATRSGKLSDYREPADPAEPRAAAAAPVQPVRLQPSSAESPAAGVPAARPPTTPRQPVEATPLPTGELPGRDVSG